MPGRHRKPPKYEEAMHYGGWVVFWLLLVVLILLVGYMLKEIL